MNNNQKEMNVTIISRLANSHIMRIAVSFSRFMFDITVIFLLEGSPSAYSLHMLGKGQFGSVFICSFDEKEQFAIKSISYFSDHPF